MVVYWGGQSKHHHVRSTMLFLMPDTSRLDYYTYGDFNGTPTEADSGFFATCTGINPDCDFSFLDLSGCSVRNRRYGSIYTGEYPPGLVRDVTSISQYNSIIWPGALISPKHFVTAGHLAGYFSSQYGFGTNVMGFFKKNGELVTQEFNPNVIADADAGFERGDWALFELTSPITDPDVKIYNKILDETGDTLFEQGTATFTLSSNGQVQPAYIENSGNIRLSTGLISPDDDIYKNALTFSGDSGSPVFIHHPVHGTVFVGPVAMGSDYPIMSNTVGRYISLKNELNQLLADNGGYEIEWLTPADLGGATKVKDALIMSTEEQYTPSTSMNAKEIVCEVTAIRGDDTTKKSTSAFAAISGNAPPDLDFDGNFIISNIFTNNSFHEGTQLLWEVDCDDAFEDTFPPTTLFTNIVFGPTLNNAGISGSVLASSISTMGLNIPDGVSGASMNVSVYSENIFGRTGDPNKYYPIGSTLIQKRGFGPTFDSFSFNDTSPSPGDTITGTFAGWTMMPDRGNSTVNAVGVGFSYTPTTANFSGDSFTITIPAEAEAGDTLIIVTVDVSNAYNSIRAVSGQSITIA